jgi:aminopeptidase N
MRKKLLFMLVVILSFSVITHAQQDFIGLDDHVHDLQGECCSHKHTVLAELHVQEDLDHNYDARKYDINLQLNLSNGSVRGQVHMDCERKFETVSLIDLHFVGTWNIERVLVNGVETTSQYDGAVLSVNIPQLPGSPKRLRVSVEYSGIPTNYADEGYSFLNMGSDYAWTMSQPYQARYWFPCYDLPIDKAEEGVVQRITVPSGLTVAANGQQTEVINNGATRTFVWVHDKPIATYLVAFGAARYVVVEDNWKNKPILYYLFPEHRNAGAYDLARHPEMLDLYSQQFGDYPFDSYGVMEVQTPRYFAMEHQTMTTLSTNLVRGDRAAEQVYAHELAHHWWGDSVTLENYRHIWLNEGFASYGEILYWEEFFGKTVMRQNIDSFRQRVRSDAENVGHHSLYRDLDNIRLLFSTTVYKKGALVMHALRYAVGDEAFFKGLQNYHKKYIYSTALTKDFRAQMEQVSGLDLKNFFQSWVYGIGWPKYALSWCNITVFGKKYRYVTVSQVQDFETVFDNFLSIDLDGDGPRGVSKCHINGKHTQFIIEPTNGMSAPRIVDQGHIMYDEGEITFSKPNVLRQSKNTLKKGRLNTFYLRADNINAATVVLFNAKDAELKSSRLINNGNTLEIKVNLPEKFKRKSLGYKLINPDGKKYYKAKAFTVN